MKSAVIDVGGGLRGIYAAGQIGRNYQFYTEYSKRREYMSFRNFLRRKSYIDMDYIYGVLSNDDGENPLDYPAMAENPMELVIVATNAITGKAKYFDKRDITQNNYDAIKASCSIPFVCRPYVINGIPYYDGALSDPIPIGKAFSMGCDRIVLILTKPKHFRRTPGKDLLIARGIHRKYPEAADRMRHRADTYNFWLDKAAGYEQEGKLLIIAPDDTCGMDTLTRDAGAMKQFYEKGLQDGGAVSRFLREEDGK